MARRHLVLRELDGQVQRRRAVALDPLRGLRGQPRNELFQHHAVDDLVDVAFAGQQPSTARVPDAGEPSRRAGRFPPAPAIGSAGDVARGSGRPAGGWLASGRRRPGGSELAAAAPPTAPTRTAVE